MPQELQDLIERARRVQMTPEEREAQRVNFAYGNLCVGDENITIEDVKQASRSLKDDDNGKPASR